jgi:predicted transcriptional regulator
MHMQISKAKIETIIRALPDPVDIEEVMYRLYLLEKIEAGEADIQNGKVMTHDQAMERLSRKWQS